MAKSTCSICTAAPTKYRCSKCKAPSCSLPCFKSHSSTCPPPIDTAQTSQPPNTTPAAVPLNLRPSTSAPDLRTQRQHSQHLQALFTKHANLKAQLRRIYEATLPPAQNDSHQDQDQHHRYAGGRGKGGYGREQGRNFQPRPWTEARGFRDGMKALQQSEEGPFSEGVLAFGKLVAELSVEGDTGEREQEIESLRT